MNILLINTNPVVSRLISLCMRDEFIVFEEVTHVSEVSESTYDIVFVDDASYNDKMTVFSTWGESVGKFVLLSSRDMDEEIGGRFDMMIKKPFLPSQIQAVIDQVKKELPSKEEELTLFETDDLDESVSEEHFIFPLASSSEVEDKIPEEEAGKSEGHEDLSEVPKVLDSNEIEQIKALLDESDEEEVPMIDLEDEKELEARKVEVITQKLEEDGLEIVEEKEIIEALSAKPKRKKKKTKSKKMKKKKDEVVYTFEEALLAAVENMKPKKIKKLLKGAEVTIQIRFKDDA